MITYSLKALSKESALLIAILYKNTHPKFTYISVDLKMKK